MLLIFLNELFRVIEVCEWRVISISECFILDTACFAIRISNRSGLTNALFYFVLFYVLACCAIVWQRSVCFVCLFYFACFLFFSFLFLFSFICFHGEQRLVGNQLHETQQKETLNTRKKESTTKNPKTQQQTQQA